MSPGTFYKFAMIGRNMKETIIRPCILIGPNLQANDFFFKNEY